MVKPIDILLLDLNYGGDFEFRCCCLVFCLSRVLLFQLASPRLPSINNLHLNVVVAVIVVILSHFVLVQLHIDRRRALSPAATEFFQRSGQAEPANE